MEEGAGRMIKRSTIDIRRLKCMVIARVSFDCAFALGGAKRENHRKTVANT